MSELTPSQAADIILWQQASMNRVPHARGWKDKVGLGHVTVRCANFVKMARPPDGTKEVPVLTHKEAARGLDYINLKEVIRHKHDGVANDARVDKLVDSGVACYSDARQQ